MSEPTSGRGESRTYNCMSQYAHRPHDDIDHRDNLLFHCPGRPAEGRVQTECLFLGTSETGIPVIAEWALPSDYPDARPATDEEYQAYLNYWNAECPVCGVDRGSKDFCVTAPAREQE